MTTLSDCGITSNRAKKEGGAIFLEPLKLADRFVDVINMTRCHIVGNTASSGGALAVANGSHGHIWDSSVESNRATGGGSAVLVHSEGKITVSRSDFESNPTPNSDDTIGVITLGYGKVVCEGYESCWPVCTKCRELPMPMMPMPSPAPQVQAPDSPSQQAGTVPELGSFVDGLLAGALLFVLAGLRWFKQIIGCVRRPRQSPNLADNILAQPLLLVDDNPGSIEFGSVPSRDTQSSVPPSPSSDTQLRMTDPMLSLMGSSLAPMFAIDEDFCIELWSPGEGQSIKSCCDPSFRPLF